MPAKPVAVTVSALKQWPNLWWFVLGLLFLFALSFYRAEKYIYFGENRLMVEKVSTPQKLSKGLSGRENLPSGKAMLFIFEKNEKHCFWMKDMKFAIDIIWLDSNKKVIKVDRSVGPDTYPSNFCPESPVCYVLETNAGWAEQVDLHEGASIVLE